MYLQIRARCCMVQRQRCGKTHFIAVDGRDDNLLVALRIVGIGPSDHQRIANLPTRWHGLQRDRRVTRHRETIQGNKGGFLRTVDLGLTMQEGTARDQAWVPRPVNRPVIGKDDLGRDIRRDGVGSRSDLKCAGC